MPESTSIDRALRALQDEVDDRLDGRLRWLPPATLLLVGLCAGMYVVVGFTDRAAGRQDLLGVFVGARSALASLAWGAVGGRRVLHGEYWRLLTCVFLHADALHLLLNMTALAGLGRLCEAMYGSARFLWLYLLCGLAGSGLSEGMRILGGEPPVTFLTGASGAIFGLMGASLVFGVRFRDALSPDTRQIFGRGLAPWVALNLLAGFVLARMDVEGWAVPRVDTVGHLGGLLAGALLAFILGSPIIPGSEGNRWTRGLMGLGAVALLVAGAVALVLHRGR